MQDHNYDVLSKTYSLTNYSENVVSYIAGYVIKMIKKTVHCEDCLSLLIEENPDDPNYYLIKRRNLGAYLFPSKSLVLICSETEKFIRLLMNLKDDRLPSTDLVNNIVINVSAKLLPNLGRTVYSNHEHSFHLLKMTIYSYCKIRCHNLAKTFTATVQGDAIRKKFSKLIIFHHQ
ncbi:uncharacterized protein LOC108910899 [Anoplophora glabripennis]|uniref:uncharacterized protein LOC108910899 n=1 Tax=Anoplophora glabripennis TaxID=217634 RepID=UPI0008737BD7|nr:uncharacterized protein LOC108910899 [Anoplophora glabripennis]